MFFHKFDVTIIETIVSHRGTVGAEEQMEKKEKNPIQSAEKVFMVMETLAECGSMGVVELSEKLQINKSSMHRLLKSLICMGYVEQEPASAKYTLTFKLIHLAEKMRSSVDIVARIHPYMLMLANQSGETVHFVQRRGSEVIYIDKVEPESPNESAIRMASQVGMVRPMYCSGVGKAFLAEMDLEEVSRIWKESKIEKKTKYTITTLEDMKKEIKEIKRRGYALDCEENELGVRCIAVCINEPGGDFKYAISISAPSTRMSQSRIRTLSELVLETRKRVQMAISSTRNDASQ